MHNFTPEDLLQYLYQETSPSQSADIRAALQTDWSLREKFEVIKAGRQRLKALTLMSPSQRTINSILTYARKTEVELTPQF